MHGVHRPTAVPSLSGNNCKSILVGTSPIESSARGLLPVAVAAGVIERKDAPRYLSYESDVRPKIIGRLELMMKEPNRWTARTACASC